MFRLPEPQRRNLIRLAERAWPREACGVLLGRRGEPGIEATDVLGARNLATAADRFELDPGDLVAADRRARAAGLEVVGIWHSHADAPARPSAADLDGAWHGWTWLIASVVAGRAVDLRAFGIRGGRAREEGLVP